MKIMSARDAKNRFGEFLDAARREPVVITRNDRPVGVMISIEDAAETLLPELLLDKEPGYDGWLFDKVSRTQARVASGEARLLEQDEALAALKERVLARRAARTPRTA
ncbi:MAG: type II toxin-antitoxin system Phd/YefM family antitoxin [Betaproteobacteria bacterium]|nr:type II toxin-antitoxin system Phd/YefM family antitoxin [Betaproteobacteria bacterium]